MSAETYDRLHEYAERAKSADVDDLRERLRGMNRGPIKKIWADVMALWRMIVDPKSGWTSKAIAIGAVLYLVSPLDGVPDLLPLIGLTDDVAVIAAAVATLAFELKRYHDSIDPNVVDAEPAGAR
ncbi:DUF1232 domain-containing protein [bacterium]|nr:DUF1232 domain-containing protein [bacterium]